MQITSKELELAKDKTSQEEVSKFRMGKEKEHKEIGTSIKTKLIRKEGGYGGFKKRYKRNPFYTTEREAKGLIGRNEKCFCGSEKKYKRCCLIK